MATAFSSVILTCLEESFLSHISASEIRSKKRFSFQSFNLLLINLRMSAVFTISLFLCKISVGKHIETSDFCLPFPSSRTAAAKVETNNLPTEPPGRAYNFPRNLTVLFHIISHISLIHFPSEFKSGVPKASIIFLSAKEADFEWTGSLFVGSIFD